MLRVLALLRPHDMMGTDIRKWYSYTSVVPRGLRLPMENIMAVHLHRAFSGLPLKSAQLCSGPAVGDCPWILPA